jgi:hypothetical protein
VSATQPTAVWQATLAGSLLPPSSPEQENVNVIIRIMTAMIKKVTELFERLFM